MPVRPIATERRAHALVTSKKNGQLGAFCLHRYNGESRLPHILIYCNNSWEKSVSIWKPFVRKKRREEESEVAGKDHQGSPARKVAEKSSAVQGALLHKAKCLKHHVQ